MEQRPRPSTLRPTLNWSIWHWKITGEQAPISVPYRTDACILSEAVPCIVVGPGDLRQAHTVNEWVSVEQLHQSVDLYLKFIQAVCR